MDEVRTDKFPRIAMSLLRHMIFSRESDLREGILLRQGKGWLQVPSAGHEAIAALAYHLANEDYIFPVWRDRALMLARGIALKDLARDFLARPGSSSEGRNTSSHFSSRRYNVFSITTPVGAQCLPAIGVALGLKRTHSNGVVTCHIGDAATRQGEFYEAICMAVQYELPIVFVVEDNGYGISSPTGAVTPRGLGVFAPDLVHTVCGTDAEVVFRQGGDAIERARSGQGPQVLWCEVERLFSHTSADDQRLYRPPEELASLADRDPITRLASQLMETGRLTPDALEEERRRIAAEVRAEYQRVAEEASPCSDEIMSNVFQTCAPKRQPPTALLDALTGKPTLVHSVNEALRHGLTCDPRMLVFGQDIEDPKGGVFGLTRGLSTAFPGRVVNSPLAEATIVGTAVGLAASGFRPVFEIQFIDFIGPALNQLISQAANLGWRTNGDWTCPIVLYAPYGAYLPGGGMWHSQSNEACFAHLPGLRIAVPSTAQDAALLFWAAFQDADPSLILLPKHLFHCEFAAEAKDLGPIGFGEAKLVRDGGAATVVAWGNCVELAALAAERLQSEDSVEVEIIDLRTLVPCDWNAIAKSLVKTGRLIVVQEDVRSCSFGQAIIAEIATNEERFYWLAAPPQLVSRPDVNIPFHPDLELAILPCVDDIVQAVRRSLE